jgi:hypothetical protein
LKYLLLSIDQADYKKLVDGCENFSIAFKDKGQVENYVKS